jgi:hypothetical protein
MITRFACHAVAASQRRRLAESLFGIGAADQSALKKNRLESVVGGERIELPTNGV